MNNETRARRPQVDVNIEIPIAEAIGPSIAQAGIALTSVDETTWYLLMVRGLLSPTRALSRLDALEKAYRQAGNEVAQAVISGLRQKLFGCPARVSKLRLHVRRARQYRRKP